MIWIIVVLIIGVVLYFFLKDRNKMLEHQVDEFGGMRQKYSLLMEWLTSDPNARVVKVSRDHIQVSNIMQTTESHFYVTETFGGVEVQWNANLGILGQHSKKWTFPSRVSQNEMIDRIGRDLYDYEAKVF